MYNFSKEMTCFHNDEVTLPKCEQDEMRDRRNSNRNRLNDGLKKNEDPNPYQYKSQGSYAIKTMIQESDKDYDIDDGAYFYKEDLVGARGAEMSAIDVRWMVRDAIDDGGFSKAPEVRNNCVRVYYKVGYHVDIPIYRRVATTDFWGNDSVHYELASTTWKRSDARDVTSWFSDENKKQSPDTTNGRQLRRMCRLLKKFARSRDSWKGKNATGFMITKLVTECFYANSNWEDTALYDTMKSIKNRLDRDLVIHHPVTPNETLTKGTDDSKARFFRSKLTDALTDLDVLFESDCTAEKAAKAWDKVFNTTYFTDNLPESDEQSQSAKAVEGTYFNFGLLKDSVTSNQPTQAVNKGGTGTYG